MVPKGPRSATVWLGDTSNKRQNYVYKYFRYYPTVLYHSYLEVFFFYEGGLFHILVAGLVTHQFVW